MQDQKVRTGGGRDLLHDIGTAVRPKVVKAAGCQAGRHLLQVHRGLQVPRFLVSDLFEVGVVRLLVVVTRRGMVAHARGGHRVDGVRDETVREKRLDIVGNVIDFDVRMTAVDAVGQVQDCGSE